MQKALESQEWVPSEHSSISVQKWGPTRVNPIRHGHSYVPSSHGFILLMTFKLFSKCKCYIFESMSKLKHSVVCLSQLFDVLFTDTPIVEIVFAWFESHSFMSKQGPIPSPALSIGWIPGFLGFFNSVNKTWIWMTHIIELQKSLKMIPNLNQFPGNTSGKIHF